MSALDRLLAGVSLKHDRRRNDKLAPSMSDDDIDI